jgi:hypothetical protein
MPLYAKARRHDPPLVLPAEVTAEPESTPDS